MKTYIYIKLFFVPVFLLTGFFFDSANLKAQDPHFSQFYNSPLTMNPALTGAFNGNFRIISNYRNQWKSVSTPYSTFALAYDMGMVKKYKTSFPAFGVSFLSDKAGDSKLGINQLNLTLSYQAQVSWHNVVSAGILAGFGQRSIDFDALQWDEQFDGTDYDATLPSNETGYSASKMYPDFGAGLQWTFSKGEMYSTANDILYINLGGAIFHVNQPNISFYSSSKDALPLKIVAHSNVMFGIKNTNLSIIPSFMFVQQGPLKEMVFGGLLHYKLIEQSKYTGRIKGAALAMGAVYRMGDAIVPQIQLEYSSYTIGFSYDINNSSLSTITSGKGGFEISLRYVNPFSTTVSSKTPRFF